MRLGLGREASRSLAVLGMLKDSRRAWHCRKGVARVGRHTISAWTHSHPINQAPEACCGGFVSHKRRTLCRSIVKAPLFCLRQRCLSHLPYSPPSHATLLPPPTVVFVSPLSPPHPGTAAVQDAPSRRQQLQSGWQAGPAAVQLRASLGPSLTALNTSWHAAVDNVNIVLDSLKPQVCGPWVASMKLDFGWGGDGRCGS